MPPSGFSQKAINGLLVFVEDSYRSVLDRYKGQDLSEKNILEKARSDLEKRVELATKNLSGDGIISAQAIAGLKDFMTTNFYDLVQEINSGKKEEGYAMQTEIEHIGRYLKNFHI